MKVLFVDDEQDLLEQAKIFLKKENSELDIETAQSAEKAIEILDENEYDAIVSDYQMAQIDGLEFLKIIREDRNSDIPFIIFTGKGREEVAMKALNLGANRYLQKKGKAKSQYGVLADAISQEVQHIASQKDLQKSEERYRGLFESAQHGTLILDAETGEIMDTNQYIQNLTGYSKENLLGGKLWNIETFENLVENSEKFEELLEKNYTRHEKSSLTKKDGEEVSVKFASNIYEVGENKIAQLNIREISKEREAGEHEEKDREKYYDYVENAPNGVFIADEKGDYLEVNKKACDMTGYSEEELLEMNVLDLTPPEYHEQAKKSIEKVLKSGKTKAELPYISKDGSRRYWIVNAVMISDNILGFTEDITERKKIESRFKNLFNASPDPSFIVNKDGILQEANQAASDVLGYDKEKIVGESILNAPFLIEESKEKIIENFERTLQGKNNPPYTIEAESKDGGKIFAEVNSSLTEKGGSGEVIAIVRNITERKKAKDELIKEKRIFKNLTETIPEIFWLSSMENYEKMKYVSPAVEEIWGDKPDEFYQNPRLWIDRIHDEDKDRVIEAFEKLVEEGENYDAEYRIVRDDGSIRWVHDQGFPIYDSEGELTRLAGLAQDITQEKDWKEREEFLHSLLRHDVRNKAQVTQGYLELLEDFELPEEAEEYLKRGKKGIRESMDIIEKVRMLREAKKEEVKEIEIEPIIESVGKENRAEAEERDIEIEMNCKEFDSKIQGGTLLKEVFTNLVGNSIKHSGGTKIRMSNREAGDKIVCSVEDDGEGIPDSDKEKIFEKGYTTDEERGTGIGLFLVKRLLDIYEGNIEVKDSELGGARFDVQSKKPK